MEKQLKDYLHLYLGCTVEIDDSHVGKGGLIKSARKGTFLGFADGNRISCRIGFRAGPEGRVSVFFIKPILRPLNTITPFEAAELVELHCPNAKSIKINGTEIEFTVTTESEVERTCYIDLGYGDPVAFKYLLSKHFDLFGLIDAGLAIDATTLTLNPQTNEH